MASLAQAVDLRIAGILQNYLRTRVISTLRVMVGVDNAVFYTSSDVALCLLERAGITPSTVSADDMKTVISAVSSVLSDAARKGFSDVRRTTKRIHPRYYEGGRASFGYRIGLATGRVPFNPQTALVHKEVQQQPQEEAPSALALAEKLLGIMNERELEILEAMITTRKASERRG